MSDFKVGQVVYRHNTESWYLRNDPDNLRPVEITKVGRTWVYLKSNQKFRADDPSMNIHSDYTSYERCYLSPEIFHHEKALNKAWSKIQSYVRDRWSRPDHLTIEALKAATEALGFDLEAQA